MDKSPDAFRTISEVAEHLSTPAHVLRFWESRFPQVRPVKRAGGRRYYRPADVALLAGIRQLLHEEGLTIRGVQKILREQGVRHVAGLGDEAEGMTAEVAAASEDLAGAEALTEEAEGGGEAEVEPEPGPEPALAAAARVPEAMPARPRPAPAPHRELPLEVPVLAARLRALPPEALLARAETMAPLAARLAVLRAAMVERGRLARR